MGHFQPLAALGALRQERRYSIIANNMANSQTVGFKKDVMVFRKVVDEATDRVKPQDMGRVITSFQQGNLQRTGNTLDLAIDGEGFFKVQTPNGIRYTRAGSFSLSPEKILVNENGFPVMGRSGEITINGKDIVIDRDGSVTVNGGIVDQISVVRLAEPNLLKKEGQTMMKLEGPPREMAADPSQVVQGALESSNTNVIEEMMRMLDAQRTYETCVRLIQSNDEMNSKIVNEVGKI